jgi:hypothetical protein
MAFFCFTALPRQGFRIDSGAGYRYEDKCTHTSKIIGLFEQRCATGRRETPQRAWRAERLTKRRNAPCTTAAGGWCVRALVCVLSRDKTSLCVHVHAAATM